MSGIRRITHGDLPPSCACVDAWIRRTPGGLGIYLSAITDLCHAGPKIHNAHNVVAVLAEVTICRTVYGDKEVDFRRYVSLYIGRWFHYRYINTVV